MLETSALLHLIDLLYAGALDAELWEAAVAAICRAFGADAATLVLRDADRNKVRSVTFVDIDQKFRDAYGDLIWLPDMRGYFRAIATHADLGALTGDELVVAAPDFERSRFHTEWLRAQRVLDYVAAPLTPTPSVIGGLYIGRPRGANGYGERDLDALRVLRPHLLRAVQVRLRLESVAGIAQQALSVFELHEHGVVLVDTQVTVVHANCAARAVLGDGIAATRSGLACDHADDTSRLRRLVGEASAAPVPGPGGALAVRRRSGRRPLSVLVAPLSRGARPVPTGPPATAIVLVADPEAVVRAPGAQLRQLYGLTGAETRVAAALLDHGRLADVAEALGVSLATVRTLLQRAFEKTDTRRQADLVRLMLAHRLPGPGPQASLAEPTLADGVGRR